MNRIGTRSSIVLFVLASFVVSTAQARSSVPIVSHENIAITTGSKRAPSVDEVSAAITRAGQTIHYPWIVTAGGPGQLVATTVVREKHTIAVDIKYSSTSYSVTYRDSQNMNYKVAKGVPKIHPNYNVWVDELIAAINAELLKL